MASHKLFVRHYLILLTALRNTRKVILPNAYGSYNNSRRLISRSYCEFRESSQAKESNNKNAAPGSSYAEADEKKYEQDIKERILETAVKFAVDSGFTISTLTAAGQACGYPGVIHGLFPEGGADIVHYFNVKCNEQLVEHMKEWQKENPPVEGATSPPVDFIQKCIMTRILMLDPYKRHWARALGLQAMPNNVPKSLATLLSLVDDICYYAGDRSVDFNWYIRRVGLAGIYKASELFFLTDSSQDYTATNHFVHSRIKDAELIQSALSANPVAAAPQALSAAFTTAKNMLGMNALK